MEESKANKKPGLATGFSNSGICQGLFGLGSLFGCCCGSGGFSGLGSGCGFCVLDGLLGGKSLGSSDLLSFAGFLGSNSCGALAGFDLLGTRIGRFENTSRFTATIAQVVQLGATDLAALEDFNRSHVRGVEGEHAF